MRDVVFRNDQQARGVLVETVNDPGTRCSAGIRQILKMKQQPMNNGACFGSGPRMDHQSCRLLYDSQILIFKVNLERDLLRSQWQRFVGLEIHFDNLSAPNAVAGLVLAAVDTDCPRRIEDLDLGTGEVLEVLRKENVQPEPSGIRPGQDFHCESSLAPRAQRRWP